MVWCRQTLMGDDVNVVSVSSGGDEDVWLLWLCKEKFLDANEPKSSIKSDLNSFASIDLLFS